MRGWQLTVELGESDRPLFLRLAHAISDDIKRGRLRPGDRLPGSRTLGRALGVHRNTVLAAYAELQSEGWITTAAAAGTFVSTALPTIELAPRPQARSQLGFALPPLPPHASSSWSKPGLLELSGGGPDARLLPTAELARAYRRALARQGAELLAYGDPRGHARLRAALAVMLAALRGVSADADQLVITRGSQAALDLLARALLRPGDLVAVEALGYRPAWAALSSTGATLVPVPLDDAGLDVAALARLASRRRLRAIYLTPHHQYPTTAVLSAARRLRLLALAQAHDIAIFEDDYDFEFHYEGQPVLPLFASDRAGVVVYLGTLSKILAPSLRLGFVAAPPPLGERLAALRLAIDRQGDQVVECAIAELLEEGELLRHTRRMRRVYQARRDALVDAIGRRLGGAVAASPPPGGMALWAHTDPALDLDAWAARARAQGVHFHPARHFSFDGQPRPAVRLGFAALSEAELDDAVRRLAAALRRT